MGDNGDVHLESAVDNDLDIAAAGDATALVADVGEVVLDSFVARDFLDEWGAVRTLMSAHPWVDFDFAARFEIIVQQMEVNPRHFAPARLAERGLHVAVRRLEEVAPRKEDIAVQTTLVAVDHRFAAAAAAAAALLLEPIVLQQEVWVQQAE